MSLAMICRMQKTTIGLETPLREPLDRLARFEPSDDAPVLSLYLDMRPDETGHRHYESFLRKVVPERAGTLSGSALTSFERDVDRVTAFLQSDVRRSANGVAVFACAARTDFFEALQLDVPLARNSLSLGPVPHLYPLARLNDQYPRYAALLVNTNSARLFVFGLGRTEAHREVIGVKTKRTSVGGWSQARYQRHVENFHLLHMKEVVDVLDRVVREEALTRIVISCDEVARPLLMEQLPKHLSEKVIDRLSLDMHTPEHRVLAETLDALRHREAEGDNEHVQAMLDAWRAGGLGVAGLDQTRVALDMRQVEELLITADAASLNAKAGTDAETLANQLVSKAQQTSARIRFIDDPALLAAVGGVGAILRFTR
jgi:peptide chain release factor subunit 1